MYVFTLDREIEYGSKIYKVLEVLNSNMLLVVEKKIYDSGVFPMPVQVIPGE